MALFNKPVFNTVWAATGIKVAPDAAKVSVGWVVEIPPYEYDNWVRNRQDALLAHLNQVGIVSWDNTVEYQANKSYVQGSSTGIVYFCKVTNTASNPETDVQGNWEVAFQRSGEALLKSQNFADVPNKAQARDNLGIATTADYDARYLLKSSNLVDVPNKATARGNIDVYSKQEVIDLANVKSQNLADVPDKALARTNLGIATAADYDSRYLRQVQNLADVPNKASARSNLGLAGAATLNVGTGASTVAAGDDSRIVNAVQTSRQVVAGGGLIGGGSLAGNVSLGLGTPSHISPWSGNTVQGTTHTHALDVAAIINMIVPRTPVDVTGSRTLGTWYSNDRDNFITVNVTSNSTVNQADLHAYVAGVHLFSTSADMISGQVGISFLVPPRTTYMVSGTGRNRWVEIV